MSHPLKVLAEPDVGEKLKAWVADCLAGTADQWLRSVAPPKLQYEPDVWGFPTKVYVAVGSTLGSAVFGDAKHQAPTNDGWAELEGGPYLGETLLNLQVDYFDDKFAQKEAALEKMADVVDGIAGIRCTKIGAGPENDVDRSRFVDAAADKFAGTNHKADMDGFWFVPARPDAASTAVPVKFVPKKSSKKKKGKNFSAQLLEFMQKHSTVLADTANKAKLKANFAKANRARETGADFDEL